METRKIALALVLAGMGTAAQAETNNNSFYAGTGAGMYYVDFDDVDFDESALSMRAFGGYQLNEYVSFEAGYSKFFEANGDVAGIDVDVEGTAWDASVRPTLPIGERFQAFGVLGWTTYDFEVTVSDPLLSATENDNDDNMLYGLGGAYSLTDQWTVRGEWMVIDVEDADFGTLSVSATYRFR